MDSRQLGTIDAVVAEGIDAGEMPGCVVMIGRRGKTVFFKAYGHRQVEPERVAMTTYTVFDLASLTKPIATATSIMILVDQGKVRLEDRVAKYIPEFTKNGKEQITVFQLLTHQGGLIPDNPLSDYSDGLEKAWERIFSLKPHVKPGSKFVYTDVGYIVLGELIQRLSGKNVHQFSRDHIFRPLGMSETGFLPADPLRQRAAPTEQRDGKWMRGEVHDPRAYLLGGIAGHAGLFSTAKDLAVYAQMMLNNGQYGGVRILSRRSVAEMTRPRAVSSGFRAPGWDIKTGYSSNRGRSFSGRAFGHGGFTGTAIWIDPLSELFVIFLSNRLHPDGKGLVNPLVGRIGTIAADAIQDRQDEDARKDSPLGIGDWRLGTADLAKSQIPKSEGESRKSEGGSRKSDLQSPNPQSLIPNSQSRVLTGIDVLQRDGFRLLEGQRVGLITNQTGINREGIRTAQLLDEAQNVQLVALLSPEHGLEGKLQLSRIADSRDPALGLPVYSLYGETRRPTPQMLQRIDTLVFDIQDIGTRFYTYISTMGYAMQEAAKRGVRFVVLDRPNPINGVHVEGPVLDAGRESFVGFHRLPIRHGMTVGELAQMFNSQLRLELDLHVVRVEGWRRRDFFDATGLKWINPSPNMRSLTEAILYPGIGLLETTNLSVGRGTDTPFEIIGAPWLDGPRLEAALDQAGLPGVRFRAVVFIPQASKFQGQRCQGVNIVITDRDAFRPVETGFEIARQLHSLYGDVWQAAAYDRLLGNKQVYDALLAGKTTGQIELIYGPGLQQFLQRRSRFLLYEP